MEECRSSDHYRGLLWGPSQAPGSQLTATTGEHHQGTPLSYEEGLSSFHPHHMTCCSNSISSFFHLIKFPYIGMITLTNQVHDHMNQSNLQWYDQIRKDDILHQQIWFTRSWWLRILMANDYVSNQLYHIIAVCSLKMMLSSTWQCGPFTLGASTQVKLLIQLYTWIGQSRSEHRLYVVTLNQWPSVNVG